MKNRKHLFFDLDNTLWDFNKNSREALLQLFNEHHIENYCGVSFEEFITVYENINHQLWEQYSHQKIAKSELRYQRFYQTFQFFKYQNLALSHQWANDYLKISPYKTHLVEGAMDLLHYLKPNYQLHIITNGFKEVQDIKLKQCLLEPFFQTIIISEEHGVSKPDKQIFELAQELTQSTANECVMIGDNLEADIFGALNAQWKAIHLAEHAASQLNDYKHITKLQELKSFF